MPAVLICRIATAEFVRQLLTEPKFRTRKTYYAVIAESPEHLYGFGKLRIARLGSGPPVRFDLFRRAEMNNFPHHAPIWPTRTDRLEAIVVEGACVSGPKLGEDRITSENGRHFEMGSR